MATCVIFCAAGFDGLVEPIGADDFLMAADGGLVHMEKLGLTPHGILGDFDSLGYVPQDAKVFPVEKDDTDAMLAVRQGLALGYSRFLLYGSLDGPRLDHTIANFQTLRFLADNGAEGWLVGKEYLVTVVKNRTLHLPEKGRGIVSVFCLGADAKGVNIEGLQYTMKDGTLSAGFPLGVSNHFTGETASVTVADGSLLVLYPRANGLPQE